MERIAIDLLPGAFSLVAVALLLLAAWHDLATRLLPDGIALALASGGAAAHLTLGDLGSSLLAAGLVLLGAALAWRLGALGGGDVKLLGACALVAGAAGVPLLLAATALAGGLLALPYLIGRHWPPALPARGVARVARIWRASCAGSGAAARCPTPWRSARAPSSPSWTGAESAMRGVLLLLILLAGGATAGVAWLGLAPAPDAPAPAAQEQAPRGRFLVAARPVRAGALVRTEDLGSVETEIAAAPPGAVRDGPEARAEVTGAMARRAISQGEPIRPGDVLRPGERGFLAAVLAPDMRAFAVSVDATTGAAGLIWPGDRVDLLLTQQVNDEAVPAYRRVFGETVLRDLRVIAVDQAIVQGAVGAYPVTTQTGYSTNWPNGSTSLRTPRWRSRARPLCSGGGHVIDGDLQRGCCRAGQPSF
ncbi:Flp pilus assembly protein CpaB [Roseomonas populi]|uniref:Flp pilus assembly protein CpaB n=1 Tax=Roseomonas populi TaxID=3121582 RepID=A0ABT1X4H0_9PROT|nr:Flp pilus assembly protein CpaB [Roseomonas pecuniae]MCR0981859.1 Flp pilus assembly protein CpaB [Roseomonas pecuniae]